MGAIKSLQFSYRCCYSCTSLIPWWQRSDWSSHSAESQVNCFMSHFSSRVHSNFCQTPTHKHKLNLSLQINF